MAYERPVAVKVLLVNYAAAGGGATRAATRLREALSTAGVETRFFSQRTDGVPAGSTDYAPGLGDWLASFLRRRVARCLVRMSGARSRTLQSPAWLGSGWLDRINRSDADLVHLHWVNGEMLSIEDLGRISKPVVWTLHDMWPFCGAEHWADDVRWKAGYLPCNRPFGGRGPDINRWTWERKRRHWTRRWQIVAPSDWLGRMVHESALMRDWEVCVIPNALDTDTWCPAERLRARADLGFPSAGRLLLFGAVDALDDPVKGFDLLRAALDTLPDQGGGVRVIVYGRRGSAEKIAGDTRFIDVGYVVDDRHLRQFIAAADAVVVPSRFENLPYTAVEAAACGRPVVGFAIGGMADIVEHGNSGYLAAPFDVAELGRGIRRVLDGANPCRLGDRARQLALARFGYAAVAQQHLQLYTSVLAKQ